MDQPPAKPRRWFRFSLRTLLVAMTLLCVWLGIQVNAARRQKSAVEVIAKAGGTVWFDYQLVPSKSGAPDDFDIDDRAAPVYPDWLRRLFGEDFFRNAVHVTFLGGSISAADFARLADLPRLRNLYLCEVKIVSGEGAADRCIQDSDLEAFEHLRELRDLTLRRTNITAAGMETLAKLKYLRHLQMLDSLLDDAALRQIGKMTALESVQLVPRDKQAMTDAGLKHLTGLSHLKQLELLDTAVTVEGIRELQKSLPGATIRGP